MQMDSRDMYEHIGTLNCPLLRFFDLLRRKRKKNRQMTTILTKFEQPPLQKMLKLKKFTKDHRKHLQILPREPKEK